MLYKARLVFYAIVDDSSEPDLFEEQTWVFKAGDADAAAERAAEILRDEAHEYLNVEKKVIRWLPVAFYQLEELGSEEACQSGVEVESRFLDELPEEVRASDLRNKP